MPSKDILSIHEFQLTQSQEQTQLYPRAYALPQFFTTNLNHDCRIVKIFTGENALLKAFYFNYMKLAIEGEDSDQYCQLLKQVFVGFDNIEEGQLEDKFLSDFQYRKFFKDFVQIAKEQYVPDFESTAQRYPIIDEVLMKLFKTIVPIALFLPEDQFEDGSDFAIAEQVIGFLSEQFQQEFSVEIPEKCFKFEPTDMYLYVQSLSQVYLAYIEEDDDSKGYEQSDRSSFVCGEGNSFTSKFKSRSGKGTKHPFRKIQLKTMSDRLSQNQGKVSRGDRYNLSQVMQKQQQEAQVRLIQQKSQLLQSNGGLIRRRGRDSSQLTTHPPLQQQPLSCFQYQQQNIQQSQLDQLEQSQTSLTNPAESVYREQEKANTLINILDSRVEEVDEVSTVGSGMMEREKSCMIMRRRGPGDEIRNSAGLRDKEQQELFFEKYKYEGDKIIDEHDKITEQEYSIQQAITLPQPQAYNPNLPSPSQPQYQPVYPTYSSPKPTYLHMQQIQQLGQDQDSEITIRQFCQIQSQPSREQKTVNLSDNISHKLFIERVESRNINMSKTSIGKSLNSPDRVSFFQDGRESGAESMGELDKTVFHRTESREVNDSANIGDSRRKIGDSRRKMSDKDESSVSKYSQKGNDEHDHFEEFMKSMKMKERVPLTQKSKNLSQQCKLTEHYLPAQTAKKLYPITCQVNHPSYEPQHPSGFQSYQSQVPLQQQNSHWSPSASDEFTKSDILLLLDEEYRQKIRAIKSQYKSTIRDEYYSVLKQNVGGKMGNEWGSRIGNQRGSRSQVRGEGRSRKVQFNTNMGRSRERETSIYLGEKV